MFNKTTSFFFNKYGEIVSDVTNRPTNKLNQSIIKLKDKHMEHFYSYDCDVYIKVLNGIVMLVVSNDPNCETVDQFVIHRIIKIHKGVRFNFLSITSNARIELTTEHRCKPKTIPTFDKQPIIYEPLVPTFHIKEILGYYYQIRNSSYVFNGENHNYWELTFIDNGELATNVDGEDYILKEMDLILYAPGQFHKQHSGNTQSCSYLTILFDMEIPSSYFISNRVYHASRDIHNALNNFIKVSNEQYLYSSELMICYLKELLIHILQYDFIPSPPVASTPMQQRFENELLNEILMYINDVIYEQVTIEELCNKFSISRSSLQSLFKNNLGVAPKHYISDLKLNKSKLLIKENIYTISEVSNMLGFNSIHYFSRKFKQHFGISPTDYAKTLYN